jgi:hypothetical protein
MHCLEVLEEMNQRMTEAVTIGSLLEELRQTPREIRPPEVPARCNQTQTPVKVGLDPG